MAKITRQLSDIEKLVEQAHKTPQERLKQVNEELKIHKEQTMYHTDKEHKKIVTDKEKTLIEAKKILEEQIEQEEDKKELNKMKLERTNIRFIKEEIQEELFNNINYVFKPNKNDKKIAYQELCKYDNIKMLIKDITDIYGMEFEDYTYSIYNKTLNQVYNIYKPYIKQQEQEEKELARYYKAKKQNRNKKIIATNLAICGILKWANSKRR